MDKATGAYRTISEVAEELDIPQHVLRFWETRFPQIKPMKRSGGRRYYRPADVLLLRGIRRLLYGEGYTIKGVQRILMAQGVGIVQQAGGASGEELVASADIAEAEDFSGAVPQGDADHADEAVARQSEADEDTPFEEPATLGQGTLGQATFGQVPPAEGARGFAGGAPAHPIAPLSSLHRQLLQGVLAELVECARHLEVVREATPDQGASSGS
ncbi:MerR HTH family regulatory protein [Rhizobiales bacterium GAS191]|jgi:DNA-binding transcriptional MerR regulator|nr:MerR HTH family regulatory protein [Rhizobiales bacterium GAS113]SEE25405.1 MerR HTH family regulatory protein [Rhizobiales bacterium GAS191]